MLLIGHFRFTKEIENYFYMWSSLAFVEQFNKVMVCEIVTPSMSDSYPPEQPDPTAVGRKRSLLEFHLRISGKIGRVF